MPHTSATREDIKERLQNDRDNRLQSWSPSKDIFMRTVGYLAAVQKLGCSRPFSEETFLLASEQEEREAREMHLMQIQRGYRRPQGICEGSLVFGYDDEERPYIWQVNVHIQVSSTNLLQSCEHYISTSSKDHFRDITIGNGSYFVEYIEAVMTGDEEEAARIEEEASDLGYGPLVECTTCSNVSAQKANCRMYRSNLSMAVSHSF